MTIPELVGLDVDVQRIVLLLVKNGLTNEEVANAIGLKGYQFKYLLEKYPAFKDKVDDAKEEPNFKVEQALFKRALGYAVKETTKRDGRPVQVILKEIAPDPVSCIFWLKNRSPKRWRDVIEHNHSLKDRMERAHDALSERGRMSALTEGEPS